MRYFFVKGDYNDADYASNIIQLTDEEFVKFKPLIDAIGSFQPYITEWQWEYSNWHGEKTPEETYSQFPEELVKEFERKVVNRLYAPDECYIHTIVEFRELKFTDEPLITGGFQEIKAHRTLETIKKMEDHSKRVKELLTYKRPKDGKNICSIPFKEMTPDENKIYQEYKNLWKDYV